MSSLGSKAIMAKNIRYYMDIASVKPKDVCDALKIPMPTFSDWINAKTYPRIDKIEMLSNYFGVSKADLVEEHEEVSSVRKQITDDDIKFALSGGEEMLTDKQFREVKQFVAFIKGRDSNDKKRDP